MPDRMCFINLSKVITKLQTYIVLVYAHLLIPGLGSSTVVQVLKYTKYPKYIPSTSTGQVLIILKST